jgi:hypothetical protein
MLTHIFISRRMTAALLSLLLAASYVGAEPTPEKAAEAAASKWLALVDAGKSAESWQALAAAPRAAIGQWKWKFGFAMAQREFGAFRDRKLRSAEFTSKSPGGRSGEFVLLQYDTTSTKKGSVLEKLTTMRDTDGEWRVASYTVE